MTAVSEGSGGLAGQGNEVWPGGKVADSITGAGTSQPILWRKPHPKHWATSPPLVCSSHCTPSKMEEILSPQMWGDIRDFRSQ